MIAECRCIREFPPFFFPSMSMRLQDDNVPRKMFLRELPAAAWAGIHSRDASTCADPGRAGTQASSASTTRYGGKVNRTSASRQALTAAGPPFAWTTMSTGSRRAEGSTGGARTGGARSKGRRRPSPGRGRAAPKSPRDLSSRASRPVTVHSTTLAPPRTARLSRRGRRPASQRTG